MGKPVSSGYIAVSRESLSDPFLSGGTLARGQAWQWLVANAAWKPSGKRRRHSVTHLERGQLAVTMRELGREWGWSATRAFRFVKALMAQGLVTIGARDGDETKTATQTAAKSSYRITMITICNYDKFQLASGRRGAHAKQEVKQKTQQSLLQLPGIIQDFAAEPLNQANHRESRKRSAENSRRKPHHGARGHGMVWWDHGTEEWTIYAADFRETRGADKLPENREGGRGNWFRWLGEKKQA